MNNEHTVAGRATYKNILLLLCLKPCKWVGEIPRPPRDYLRPLNLLFRSYGYRVICVTLVGGHHELSDIMITVSDIDTGDLKRIELFRMTAPLPSN
jgi:hypothetical protein